MRALMLSVLVGCGLVVVATAAEHKKDLVADAFQLPPGAHLRTDQQDDFKKMKDHYEPILRTAVKKLEGAADEKEKTSTAREVLKIKADVKERIQKILAQPNPNQPRPQPAPRPHVNRPHRNNR